MGDRGVSVTVDYIILLMVATVVLAGVVTVSATLIGDQLDRGVEQELEVTGESLAADLQEVERMVNSSDVNETSLTLAVDLPPRVSGERYSLTVDNATNELVLEAAGPDVVVTVPFVTDRLLGTDEPLPGGPVTIVAEDGTIEVQSG